MPIFFPWRQKQPAPLQLPYTQAHKLLTFICSHLDFYLDYRWSKLCMLSLNKGPWLPVPPSSFKLQEEWKWTWELGRTRPLCRASLRRSCLGSSSPEIYRGRFPAGVALRSSCSQWSCRDLQLMKLRLPSLQASGADSLLGAAGCGYGVRRHWHLMLSAANAALKMGAWQDQLFTLKERFTLPAACCWSWKGDWGGGERHMMCYTEAVRLWISLKFCFQFFA